MLIPKDVARADHERRADLLYPLARLVDVVSTLRRRPSGLPRARAHQLEPVERLQGCRGRGNSIIVDQYEVRDLLIGDEGLGITTVTRPDCDNLGAEFRDLLVSLAQLRGMLAAVQSAEMSEEHQHDWLVPP